MELFLQMGHGMLTLTKELLENWGSTTLIFSAINEKQNTIVRHSKDLINSGAKISFDPQLFNPSEGSLKLQEYEYWPKDGKLLKNISTVIDKLIVLNKEINSSYIILPGIETNEKNCDESLRIIRSGIRLAKEKTNKKVYATICIHNDAIRNHSFLESFIGELQGIDSDGFYVVPHTPNNEYIVSDSLWMTEMLKLLICLKLTKKFVFVGYCNHQSLIYSLAKVDAICSGNFLNTRTYDPKKFRDVEHSIQQRNTWFYLPNAFNEYSIPMIEIAKNRKLISEFVLPSNYINEYSECIFSDGAFFKYNESMSFKHYLFCLEKQCKMLSLKSYKDTFSMYEVMINSAEEKINRLRKVGIFGGQNRDFLSGMIPNKTAMLSNESDYGLKISLEWDSI